MTARRRFWTMLVAALAAFALMPMTAQAADPVSYIECGWDGSKVTKTPKTVSDYTQVASDTITFNNGAWYVVSGNVTVSERISLDSNVRANLILCDGATLTAEKGIMVRPDAVLNIYAQEQGTGTLHASAPGQAAAIGGGRGGGGSIMTGGTITIHGGNITAVGGNQAAGIGGGGWQAGCGPVTIYDGTVTATGGNSNGNTGGGAGIGGATGGRGHNGGGSKIRIYGGTVTATGGQSAAGGGAGIGGGESGAGGSVYIYGGVVNANGGTVEGEVGARGIGAGKNAPTSDNGTLTLGSHIRLYGDDRLNPPTTVRYSATDIEANYTGTRFLHLKASYVEPLSYLEWDAASQQLIQKTALDYTVVESSTSELKNGWYAVKRGDVNNYNRITVTGGAHLILCDGASLMLDYGGIQVNEGKSLSIYAQSNGGGMGYLRATGSVDSAAIGGNGGSNCGEVAIHGGSFRLTGNGGGAGIGGGNGGTGGTVIIYGGDIDSMGGTGGGAGIGGGNGGAGGRVEIYGGEHDLEGRSGGAGIGGGRGGAGGEVEIYGGEVWAYGDYVDSDYSKFSMGIGRGYGGSVDGDLRVGSGLYVYGGANQQESGIILPENGDYARHRYMTVNRNAPPHSHVFSYSADGAVITATCTGLGSCPQHYDNGVTLTITAEDGIYDGTTSFGASLEGLADFNRITGQSVSEEQIEYYEGSTRLDSAPVDVGDYTARITVEGETASVGFTVREMMDSEVIRAPEANELSFTGEPQELVTAGEARNGTMQYALGNAGGALTEFSETIPKEQEVGFYYVWYKVKGNFGYRDTDPDRVLVEIKPAPAVKYTVTFKDEDGTVLLEDEYAEGTPAAGIARPADPAKPDDGQYTYAFAGWDPEIADVTADAVYTAVYTRSEIPELDPKPDPAPAPGSDPNQMGADGTPVGPGASAAAADKAITTMKKDADPKGSVFGKLKLRSTKQSKTSIKLKWSKVSGAAKYVVYGNKCGKTSKPVKLATTTGAGKTFKKVAGKKVKKGTYYKFIVVALDRNGNVVSTSKLIHVATKGGKVGNDKKVAVPKQALSKAKKLKKGKSLKLGAKASPQSKKLKVKRHVKMRYESTNAKIATVSSRGAVKARAKGTCYVYAYAQDGVYKKVKVTVK